MILGSLAAADAELRALRHGDRGVVRIVAFPSAARVLLPELWRLIATTEPRLRIAEAEPEAAIELLRQRESDLAVVHAYSLLPRDLPPGCEQQHLADDPVLLAMHPRAAAERGLAPGQPADLSAFGSENWLMPSTETSCHELTRRACGAAGFVPAPVALASDFSVLTALVAVGAGVALVPRMALPSCVEDVSLHPLTTPVTRTISALTRTGEAGRPFLGQVLTALRTAAAT